MFVINYINVRFSTNGYENNFQIVLYEGSNDIQVNYQDVISRGVGRTTAGIENKGGTAGLQYPRMDESGHYAELSVRYTASPLPEDPQTFFLYFPHIATEGDWETEIAVINSGDEAASGVFIPYNEKGESVSDPKSLELNANGRKAFTISHAFADANEIRYIVFESDSQDMSGYLKFYTDDVYRVAVPAVARINSDDVYISHIASDLNWWTGISLVNTNETTTGVTLAFDNGAEKPFYLKAHEYRSFTIKELFGGIPQPDIGSAVIKRAKGVVGLELFGAGSQLSGILLKDQTRDQIYFPHLAGGDWWTGIVAYNPGPNVADIEVVPYDAAGMPLQSQYLSVFPRDKYIGLASALDLPDEAAWLSIQASTAVTGFELFGTRNGKQLAGYTGVGISSKSGVFPKLEAADNGWTGIAFVNISTQAADVDLRAYDDDGDMLAHGNFKLNPKEKIVNMAEALFDGGQGEAIRDASYIQYKSDQEVVGFQLNAEGEMMLDGLPALTPGSPEP